MKLQENQMSKVNKILIIHGWNANPHDHWFNIAQREWQKFGYDVKIPEMPGNYFPKLQDWLKIIDSYKVDENWILIGHSLGGVAILKYLENAPHKISKAILIATPYDAMNFGALNEFFNGEFNWQGIRQNCSKFEIINEDQDPAIPLEHGRKYAQALEGKLHIIPGFTHFHKMDLDFLKNLLN